MVIEGNTTKCHSISPNDRRACSAKCMPCTFGPNHDKCRAEVSASGDDASSLPKLPSGGHYGQCEEVGRDNELGCDVINESDLPNGYKQGIADAKHDRFAGDEITNRTGDFMDGYIMGYCSVDHAAQKSIPGFNLNCSQPLYPGTG